MRFRVQHQIGDFEHVRPDGRRVAASHGPKTRDQHFKRKWLSEVIVRAIVEAAHDIRGGIACGQHQDWHP